MFKHYLTLILSFVLLINIRDLQAVRCDFDGTRLVNNFNETGFLGTWHELERTTFQWGDGTWYSQVWTFKRGNDGQLYMAYTGFSPRTQSCTAPNTGLLSGTGGSYTLTSEGRYEAALRVAYTDYENVALVYMCYAPEIQGTCDRTSVHVSLLSRTPSLSTPQRSMLKAHLDLKCVEDHHLNQATTGLNALFYVVN
ncbi:uncharacterized protein LOC133192376 [Saccostrea echinata]|uniref:uncharacterized protein LOC133192376 n=1 Tax=Saccostrea echinata TaxID=191078 RepID=UPI002A7FDBF6|nr:uncharacterized protein LOC133192376 [Saccostrea echinata]